jgi:two-component system sensor histidine kinase MtrB
MIEPAVRLVVSETRRLGDLVENLMEVTRFDAGTARLVLDEVDIADQITACVDARAWLDAVELDAERGITARLDPRRLDVILANLIGNALKHGGSPVRVSVRVEDAPHAPLPPHETAERGERGDRGDRGDRGEHLADADSGADAGGRSAEEVAAAAGKELVVLVRDHGPGIPEEVLPHVFDRFYTASASRPRSEGSGLGLSIALENAHIHGGDISAANSPDGGAVFTLRLPLDASAAAEEAAEATRAGAGGGRRDGENRSGKQRQRSGR